MRELDEDQAAALVVRWGAQLDLCPITAIGPGELCAEAVTGYIAK